MTLMYLPLCIRLPQLPSRRRPPSPPPPPPPTPQPITQTYTHTPPEPFFSRANVYPGLAPLKMRKKGLKSFLHIIDQGQ